MEVRISDDWITRWFYPHGRAFACFTPSFLLLVLGPNCFAYATYATLCMTHIPYGCFSYDQCSHRPGKPSTLNPSWRTDHNTPGWRPWFFSFFRLLLGVHSIPSHPIPRMTIAASPRDLGGVMMDVMENWSVGWAAEFLGPPKRGKWTKHRPKASIFFGAPGCSVFSGVSSVCFFLAKWGILKRGKQ